MKWTLIFLLAVRGWGFEEGQAARMPAKLAPPDVKRGDKVGVTVTSGGVLLTFEAEVESSAHVGESVIVLNPESGRRFVARVQDKGKVIVKK